MEKIFTARDILTYLASECLDWIEDVDGEISDGRTIMHVTHYITITNSVLQELIDMAGIPQRGGETQLEALMRASEEDEAAHAQAHSAQ